MANDKITIKDRPEDDNAVGSWKLIVVYGSAVVSSEFEDIPFSEVLREVSFYDAYDSALIEPLT